MTTTPPPAGQTPTDLDWPDLTHTVATVLGLTEVTDPATHRGAEPQATSTPDAQAPTHHHDDRGPA